jgi:hypothetical protein
VVGDMTLEKIEPSEKLRTSYPKINAAIDAAEQAKTDSTNAVSTANAADTQSKSTQAQLDQVVIEGDSSVEAAQARVKADGTTFTTLQERLNNSDAELAENTKHIGVSVKDKKYGAKGDGVTDDTSIIQNAFNTEDIIIIPTGTFMINAITKLNVPANKTVIFEKGAVLKAITNGSESYTILNINSDNVTIFNPEVIGDRATHTGTTGEWGHGIVVTNNAKNVKIYNPKCSDCWGDGFVVYGAENLFVENLIANNNRRQGLTITRIKKGLFLNPICSNSNGTSPQAGIDIEPNTNADFIDGLTIINPKTENNNGSGINISLKTLNGSNQNVNIVIDNHFDDGSLNGLAFGPSTGNNSFILEGRIKVKDPRYFNSNQNGIEIRDYSSVNTPVIEIDNPLVVNPNTSNQTSPRYASGISLFRGTGDLGTLVMGNVIINKPTIIDNRATPLLRRGVYLVDDIGVEFENVNIIDPQKIKGVTADNMINVRKGVKVRDSLQVTKLVSTTTTTFYNVAVAVITNEGATSLTSYSLNQQNFDAPIKFVNRISNGLRIIPLATQNFLPISSVNGKYLETTQIGASITIRRLNENSYVVENIVGTWTVQP